jgi:hypothetical protein
VADKHEIQFEGQTFELQTGQMSSLALAQFMDAMSDDDPDSAIPPRVLLRLLRASIAKKDWRRFEDLADGVEDGFWDKAFEQIIVPRMTGQVEEKTDHPTGLPSGSTDGQEVTPLKSVSASSRIVELSHGRPDRFWMLNEAQKAAEALAEPPDSELAVLRELGVA